MAQPTKLELSQRLTTMGRELEAARVLIAEHEATIAALKAQGAKLQRPQRQAYTPAPPSAEQLAHRAAMAAARDEAMRTGSVVKVGG